MILLLLLGCLESDQARWRRALQEPDVETALGICDGLEQDEDVAACMLDVLEVGDAITPARCEQLPDSRWSRECWFRASEMTSGIEALELCAKTGDYLHNCMHHQFQQVLRDLNARNAPMNEFFLTASQMAQVWGRTVQTRDLEVLVRKEVWRLYTARDTVRAHICMQAPPIYRNECPRLVERGIRLRLITASSRPEKPLAPYCEPDAGLPIWVGDEGAAYYVTRWLDAWCAAGQPALRPNQTRYPQLAP